MDDAISMEHQVEQETKTSVPSLALTTQNPPMTSFITDHSEMRHDATRMRVTCSLKAFISAARC